MNQWLGPFIALLIAVAIAYILIALAVESPGAPALQPNPLDGEILTLDRVALDSAYRAQMGILFTTWLQDPQLGPQRAMTGARWARLAYIDVRKAFDEREARFNAQFGFVAKECK